MHVRILDVVFLEAVDAAHHKDEQGQDADRHCDDGSRGYPRVPSQSS